MAENDWVFPPGVKKKTRRFQGVFKKKTRRFQGVILRQKNNTCKNIWVFPKTGVFPKWMVYNNGKPYFLNGMFFLGGISPPLFSEANIHRSGACQETCWLPQKDRLQRELHLTWPCGKFTRSISSVKKKHI